LEVFEVEHRFPSLRLRVLEREEVEQRLQKLAVARRELVERSLAQTVSRGAERTGALTDGGEVCEIEQALGVRIECEGCGGGRVLLLGRTRVGQELSSRFL